MLSSLYQDLLFALRMMRKAPIVTLIAVASLTLAIAANTSIFSLLNFWLLRPLPYPDPERLVMVWETRRGDADPTQGVTPANFFDWREEATGLEQWSALSFETAHLTGRERPLELMVARVTPEIFPLLGASPMVGRTFTAGEGGPEDSPTVVLSEVLWRNTFGADRSVPGTVITLDDEAHTVVGVMPETFDFILGSVDLWIADTFERLREEREAHSLTVAARIAAGSDFDRAQAEMSLLAARLEERYPDTNRNWQVNVETVRQMFPGRVDTSLIQIVAAVVLMVLLIACFNIANLLLARTEVRQREIEIRRVMGAGRWRIARQLLTESLLLGLVGCGLGLALSVVGIDTIARAMPEEMPDFFRPRFDTSVALFGIGLALLAGLGFGLTPVLQTLGLRSSRSALLEGGRGGTASRRRQRLRSGFVVAQFALALAILIGTAVLDDLFHRRLDVEPGFDPTRVLTVSLNLPEHRYDSDETIRRFTDALDLRLAEIGILETAARATILPRSRAVPMTELSIAGEPTEPGEEPTAALLSVSAGYFETLHTALVEGRSFTAADTGETAPVAIVNARLAERFFPAGDALGQELVIAGTRREIVGVASDITQLRLSGLEPEPAAVYLPERQQPQRRFHLLLRTRDDPRTITTAVQRAVWAVDPDQPIGPVRTLEEHIALVLAGPELLTNLLFQIGLLTLVLAAIGIYGVMAYAVAQRRTEIGIRMAIGARPRRILTRTARDGLTLAAAGLVLGAPVAGVIVYAISRLLAAGAAEIGPVEGIGLEPIFRMSLLLATVGGIACALPAWRATRVDPVRAVQDE